MPLALLLLLGLAALAVGGDVLVRGAVTIAQRLRIPPLLIGLTLVGFGTSTPELVTSLQAALAGAPGIAIGNVVGSNIANVLLILGVAALIAPFAVDARTFRRDAVALAGSALLLLVACRVGAVSAPIAVVLLASLAIYLTVSLRRDARADDASEEALAPSGGISVTLALLFVIGGIALTILGARWLVAGATELARGLGVSETVIGLTIVAVGTSLPELVTSVTAALRRQTDLAFGNVVGSNVFNVLFILGVTALVRPIPVPPQVAAGDVWVMLAVTAALIVVAATGWRVSRAEGGALLTGYAAYLAWLAATAF